MTPDKSNSRILCRVERGGNRGVMHWPCVKMICVVSTSNTTGVIF